jgi:signal transduction histidine kinase
VDHIRHIVSLQQANARAARIIESVPPGEIMDAAVELLKDSLARHRVEVVRAYDTRDPMSVDKHTVLQILVNIIKNAREATSGTGEQEASVWVSVRRRQESGAEEVLFEVRDNGRGIAPEDLTRVFSHGFTTRADGHGFGLHSAANAAKSLGGRLTAHSDGPGRGARFELVLPAEARRPGRHTAVPASAGEKAP